MVDLKNRVPNPQASNDASDDERGASAEPLAYDLIERMFFGYRDFVGVADALLAETGYGRAHHRALHFVDRNPGLTVGELIGILKISKQGLARVLKTLIADGLIEQRPGTHDRREKQLFTTPAGHALAVKLATRQTEHLARALAALPPGAKPIVADFLAQLVDAAERPSVLSRIRRGRP